MLLRSRAITHVDSIRTGNGVGFDRDELSLDRDDVVFVDDVTAALAGCDALPPIAPSLLTVRYWVVFALPTVLSQVMFGVEIAGT